MIQVSIVMFFFALMGIAAILKPRMVFAFFDTPAANPNIRNEIRAVYGGFGLAVAGILYWGAIEPTLSQGIYLTVAVSLIGMAAGRFISLIWERPGKWPVVFFAVEIALALALISAAH